jgi:hypothetical protein
VSTLDDIRLCAQMISTCRDAERAAVARMRMLIRRADAENHGHNKIAEAATGGMSRGKVFETFKDDAA